MTCNAWIKRSVLGILGERTWSSCMTLRRFMLVTESHSDDLTVVRRSRCFWCVKLKSWHDNSSAIVMHYSVHTYIIFKSCQGYNFSCRVRPVLIQRTILNSICGSRSDKTMLGPNIQSSVQHASLPLPPLPTTSSSTHRNASSQFTEVSEPGLISAVSEASW